MPKDQSSLTTVQAQAQSLVSGLRKELESKTVQILDAYEKGGIKAAEEAIKGLLDDRKFLRQVETRYQSADKPAG